MLKLLAIFFAGIALVWATAVMPYRITYDVQTDMVTCSQTVGSVARCNEQSVSSLFSLLVILLSAVVFIVASTAQTPTLLIDRLDRLLASKLFDPIHQALRSGALQAITYA